ncbi:DinB family protein [Jiulongibacter sediminis]|jgi:uncharacterized damage-inducible protein DinB|uniref:DinB family protein n=1 Tax=Jiulongibacter sediminis TaxID=1605367 RepID=UPI0026F25B74|nr:DinB family protein [Jiulongibacter sediminis]
MNFDLQKTVEILERTPQTLQVLLGGISEDWTHENEGEGTWSAKEIISHLILGERTDWIPRLKIIFSDRPDKTFEPFDMEAHLDYAKTYSLESLLAEFQSLRNQNIETLKSLKITEENLDQIGIHPALGKATARELLATWTVHDLGHISQIGRVMAKQYRTEVGPWTAYAGILKK